MKRFFVMVAALLFAFSANAQTSLAGRVTNVFSEPLVGANVFIINLERGVATDSLGHYRLDNLPPGTYDVRISFIGFKAFTKKITLQNGSNEWNIQLQREDFQLDELIVKATRAGRTTPMTYVNIKKAELEPLNLGQDMPFLLQWTPSAVVTSDAGAGIGYTGIWIRGSDPTRINVTINGIPYNDSESQNTFWVNLPDFATSTSDIQIQRGVGSSTNGAGAFGATINLNTSRLRSEPYAEINTTAGSFNTRKGNVLFGTGLLNNKFTIDGRLSRITSDGYIERASADLQSYYLSGAMTTEKSMLRLNIFSGHEVTYQAWNGVPPDLLSDRKTRRFNSAGTEKEGEPYDNEVDNYRQTHYQLLYNHQVNRYWNVNTALHYTRGLGYFEQYKANQAFEDYNLKSPVVNDAPITHANLIRQLWLDNHFYGVVYSLNYNKNRVDALLGGGWHIYEGDHYGKVIWAEFAPSELGDRYYFNDARKGDFNIYSKLNYALSKTWNAYADLQYRRVDYTFLGFNNDLQNVTQSAELHFFNPKAGILYERGNTNFYASFAVANREPNRNDYVESTPATRPRPERLYNTEIGWRQTWKKAAFGANVYHMYYRDQLALNGQINDVGAFTRVNIDRSYRLGLELMGGVQLFPKLRLDGNATFSRNKIQYFKEFIDVYDADFNWLAQETVEHRNTDLSFSPNVIAGVEFTWQPLSPLQMTLSTKYVSRQYIDNTSDPNNVIDAYTFTNGRLRYIWKPAFAKEIAATLLVQNIFDVLYETNAWSYRYRYDGTPALDQGFYPQAGTNFLLGLSVKF